VDYSSNGRKNGKNTTIMGNLRLEVNIFQDAELSFEEA
jgi:hypothetical protein